MNVVTRFAPSPTGLLHIGGARTALFNWLFARHHGGTYLLRIEDTDRARSTAEAIEAIHDGLSWLGLEGDAQPVSQSAKAPRHAEVAMQLVEVGAAYRCYLSDSELESIREKARAEGKPVRSPWRDRTDRPDAAFVVRMKMLNDGVMSIEDAVQGCVSVQHAQLDDMVILRADGSPTYMLAVVVDDHDMGITHVIRGDDHLNNAFRQTMVYRGMGWDVPVFAHIPLIHGADGAKLSKRHGALGVDAYRDMGFLPDAMVNYLLRLGWSHGDEEIKDIAAAVGFLVHDGAPEIQEDAAGLLDENAVTNLHKLLGDLPEGPWETETLQTFLKDWLAENGLKMKDIGLPLRAALTGTKQSPSIVDVMAALGPEEAADRIRKTCKI